jgi:hypothetical protein
VPKYKLLTGAFFGYEWREDEVLCPLNEMSSEAVQQYKMYRKRVRTERKMDKLKVRIAREFVPPGNVIWLEKRKVSPPAAASAWRGLSRKDRSANSALPQSREAVQSTAEKQQQQQRSEYIVPLHCRLLQRLRGKGVTHYTGMVGMPDSGSSGHDAVEKGDAETGAAAAESETWQHEQQRQLVEMLGGGAVAVAAAAAATGAKDGKEEDGGMHKQLASKATTADGGGGREGGTAGQINGGIGDLVAGKSGNGASATQGLTAVAPAAAAGGLGIAQQQEQQHDVDLLLPGAVIAASRTVSMGRSPPMMRLIPHWSDSVSLIAGGMVVSRSMFMDHVPDLQLANLKKVSKFEASGWFLNGAC